MNNSPQKDLFGAPMENTESSLGQPLVSLVIPGRLPSWNDILGMEHWARDKFKTSLQEGFSSALRAAAQGSSMRTTSAKSIMLTAADTLDSYMRTRRERRKLRSAKKRLEKESPSLLGWKSSPSSKPPF